jgi:hypothetical protein
MEGPVVKLSDGDAGVGPIRMGDGFMARSSPSCGTRLRGIAGEETWGSEVPGFSVSASRSGVGGPRERGIDATR